MKTQRRFRLLVILLILSLAGLACNLTTLAKPASTGSVPTPTGAPGSSAAGANPALW